MSSYDSDFQKELLRDVKNYLAQHPDATDEEKAALKDWVMAGFSIGDNPYMLYDDDGFPMDFITGCRIGEEMVRDFNTNPSDFFRKWGFSTDLYNMKEENDPQDDLPF